MARTTSTTAFTAMNMSDAETVGVGSLVFFIVVAVILGGALILYVRNRPTHTNSTGPS